MRPPHQLCPNTSEILSINSHITRPTLALWLRNTRLATALINLIRIAEVRLVATEALRSKVNATVGIASLAAPTSTVRRRHSNGTELGGFEDANTAIIVATQRRESRIVGCGGGVGALEGSVALC